MLLRRFVGIYMKMSSAFRGVIEHIWLLTSGSWDDSKYWRDDTDWNDS